jgi:glycosyltransferase involved in cell wall biosynthesis
MCYNQIALSQRIMAKIFLDGAPYLIRHNCPRNSQHIVNQVSQFSYPKYRTPWGKFSVWKPEWDTHDVIHTFNTVPCTHKPWVVTAETVLPIGDGDRTPQTIATTRDLLLEDNCQSIIVVSDHARKCFLDFHKDWGRVSDVLKKIELIYPNVRLDMAEAKTLSSEHCLHLAFVGNDWFRKGGIVILRVARLARDRDLPVQVHIVSDQSSASNLGHQDISKYTSDFNLLNLETVKFYGSLPNPKVIELLRNVDFQILASLNDQSAYSILEGFSVGTPAIATNVGAIPEYELNGKTGYLLNLPLNSYRSWQHLHYPDKGSDQYWEMLDSVYTDLAQKVMEILENFWESSNRQETYERLSAGAIERVKQSHDSEKINQQLDKLYSSCLSS